MSSLAPLFRAAVAAAIVLCATTSPAPAENWPAWRGPGGQGVSAEKEPPLAWSRTENVRWKIPLPARGNSTPIVWQDRVFLTQATDEDRGRWTYCIDRASGKVLWRKGVAHTAEEPTHETNPYCSASPVTDGERVISSYGSAGLYAYDFTGNELWKRDLGEFRHIWGNAASPLLAGDACYLNCGPGPRTFLVALDKTTGKPLWQKDIAGGREGGDSATWTGSWSTPLLVRDGARDVLLASYPHWLYALDPASGAELWKCEGLGNLVYTSPLWAEGVAVAMSGFQGPALAVEGGGEGEITAARRLWRQESSPQRIGSGVIRDGRLFIVNDNGIAQCLALRTGELVWRERLGAQCWSSLVLAGDRLYSLDREGTCFVFRAAATFELLARNALAETTRSSVAIADGDLFVRTYEHLWCIGRPPAAERGETDPRANEREDP